MKLALSFAVFLPFVLAGCVIQPVERDGLPRGVTLLDSDEGECAGVLEIQGHPDLRIDEGQETVVAVNEDDDLEWQCLADYDSDEGEFDCPTGTSYVRVFRDEDDPDFKLECYGS